MSEFTPKQQRFIQEYLIDYNATQAAIRAGYSENTAYSIGHENLTKPEIKAAIESKKAELAEKTGITQERVLREYAKLGFFDIRKAYTEDGDLKNVTSLDDDTAAAVMGIDEEEIFEGYGKERKNIGRLKKMRFADKKGALDSMARHLGMFTDKTEVTITNSLADRLDEALKKIDG